MRGVAGRKSAPVPHLLVVEREHVGEPNPHDGVVVDEHHADGERAGGGGHEFSSGFPARSSTSVIGPGGPSLLEFPPIMNHEQRAQAIVVAADSASAGAPISRS